MSGIILPQSWQDWHIIEEIGEGAYGRVYRAEKENGGVKAVSAIKVIQVPSERSEFLSLHREFRSEEELRRNLKEMVDGYANEIRAMYRLQGHTHLVSIQDHLVEELNDGFSWRIFIRMEYLQSFNDYAMTHTFSREEIIRTGLVSKEDYDQLEKYALALFQRGTEMAAQKGLILVDPKYEFGKRDGKLYLIDEIHTPDSSRYFYADGYEERLAKGEHQRQLSKEFVREWLMDNGFQGKEGQKVPEMTDEIVNSITDRYIELYEHITGEKFQKAEECVDVTARIEKNVTEYLNTL